METVLLAMVIFGLLQSLAAGVWYLVAAFREGVGHGLLMLFFSGIYSIIFTIRCWPAAKRPFFLALTGGGMLLAATLLQLWLVPEPPTEVAAESVAPEDAVRQRQLFAAMLSQAAALARRERPTDADQARAAELHEQLTDAILSQARSKARQAAPLTLSGRSLAAANKQPGAAGPPPAKTRTSQAHPAGSKPAAPPAARAPSPPALNATEEEWEQARARLHADGILQSGTQLLATVNQQVVGVNDHIAVELKGHSYFFRVRSISLEKQQVEFDPLKP